MPSRCPPEAVLTASGRTSRAIPQGRTYLPIRNTEGPSSDTSEGTRCARKRHGSIGTFVRSSHHVHVAMLAHPGSAVSCSDLVQPAYRLAHLPLDHRRGSRVSPSPRRARAPRSSSRTRSQGVPPASAASTIYHPERLERSSGSASAGREPRLMNSDPASPTRRPRLRTGLGRRRCGARSLSPKNIPAVRAQITPAAALSGTSHQRGRLRSLMRSLLRKIIRPDHRRWSPLRSCSGQSRRSIGLGIEDDRTQLG